MEENLQTTGISVSMEQLVDYRFLGISMAAGIQAVLCKTEQT